MTKPIKPNPKTFSFVYLIHDVLKILLALPGLLWFRPKIIYENAAAKKKIRGGALVIANHIGFFDPVYLQYCIWYRRHHFVCLDDFFKGPFALMFKAFLCIPINKKNISIKTFKDIIEHLKCDELVTLFPEGGIETNEGELDSFKSGMILMAVQSKKPIVPVYIRKRKSILNRLTMCVGEAVDPIAATGDKPNMKSINAAAVLLREKEQKLSNL
ncbi:MAG: 1-acyl-sn-glycerol-3-phosphate acyltransferase [Clostridia bacterium]|nr:1-acyl-sn-glycerol-3-phosphate acyltransferase [Clostridia bacterium]